MGGFVLKADFICFKDHPSYNLKARQKWAAIPFEAGNFAILAIDTHDLLAFDETEICKYLKR